MAYLEFKKKKRANICKLEDFTHTKKFSFLDFLEKPNNLTVLGTRFHVATFGRILFLEGF